MSLTYEYSGDRAVILFGAIPLLERVRACLSAKFQATFTIQMVGQVRASVKRLEDIQKACKDARVALLKKSSSPSNNKRKKSSSPTTSVVSAVSTSVSDDDDDDKCNGTDQCVEDGSKDDDSVTNKKAKKKHETKVNRIATDNRIDALIRTSIENIDCIAVNDNAKTTSDTTASSATSTSTAVATTISDPRVDPRVDVKFLTTLLKFLPLKYIRKIIGVTKKTSRSQMHDRVSQFVMRQRSKSQLLILYTLILATGQQLVRKSANLWKVDCLHTFSTNIFKPRYKQQRQHYKRFVAPRLLATYSHERECIEALKQQDVTTIISGRRRGWCIDNLKWNKKHGFPKNGVSVDIAVSLSYLDDMMHAALYNNTAVDSSTCTYPIRPFYESKSVVPTSHSIVVATAATICYKGIANLWPVMIVQETEEFYEQVASGPGGPQYRPRDERDYKLVWCRIELVQDMKQYDATLVVLRPIGVSLHQVAVQGRSTLVDVVISPECVIAASLTWGNLISDESAMNLMLQPPQQTTEWTPLRFCDPHETVQWCPESVERLILSDPTSSMYSSIGRLRCHVELENVGRMRRLFDEIAFRAYNLPTILIHIIFMYTFDT